MLRFFGGCQKTEADDAEKIKGPNSPIASNQHNSNLSLLNTSLINAGKKLQFFLLIYSVDEISGSKYPVSMIFSNVAVFHGDKQNAVLLRVTVDPTSFPALIRKFSHGYLPV